MEEGAGNPQIVDEKPLQYTGGLLGLQKREQLATIRLFPKATI